MLIVVCSMQDARSSTVYGIWPVSVSNIAPSWNLAEIQECSEQLQAPILPEALWQDLMVVAFLPEQMTKSCGNNPCGWCKSMAESQFWPHYSRNCIVRMVGLLKLNLSTLKNKETHHTCCWCTVSASTAHVTVIFFVPCWRRWNKDGKVVSYHEQVITWVCSMNSKYPRVALLM